LRDALNLTQEEVGRRARITAKYLSQIENGHSSPSVEIFVRVVELGLEMPLAEFFGGEPEDDDVAAMRSLLSRQSPAMRRRALRVLKALTDD
jgi:transcriptional regulator with XRE-family HTH domain